MICPDIAAPSYFIFSGSVPDLLYYSHIPASVISLILGIFIFLKNKNSLSAKLLLILTLIFSIWSFANLGIWANVNSDLIMFLWVGSLILAPLLFLFSFYFVFVYLSKHDLSFWMKIVFLILVFSNSIFTIRSVNYFDLTNCEASENAIYSNFFYGLTFFVFLVIIITSIFYIKKDQSESKKKNIYLSIGVIAFLLSFFVTNYLAAYWDNFELEQYGLFGMTFFMGVIAYLIVKFKAFNIKMIGAQALVITLFILIAAQFAFIKSFVNMVLTGVALLLVAVFGYILIRSVKEEIKQKDAISRANEEISQRKNELQQISDHLSVANVRLKELDNAKTEFVSIVAHQLQGPPTTVKGYGTLLSEESYGTLSDEQKEILKKILNANEQQIEFVNDLLNVSRLESGRVVFNFEESDVENIIKEVVDNLFLKAKNKNLYLEFSKSSESIAKLNIDTAKIREAIGNLVDNAIKYTKRGGVNISLKICSEGAERCLGDRHIRITISDTGIGIPPDEIPRLFSKFSRGKDVKRLNASGTGLGLYVVKMIVEGNSGKVWIESEGDSKGSKFIIELPLKSE